MTDPAQPTAPAVVAAIKPALGSAVGAKPRMNVGAAWIALIAPAMALLALADLYLLVQFWPETAGLGEVPAKAQDVYVFGVTLAQVPRETLFFAMVILAGGLGGFVHALRSFGRYVGAQRLVRSWLLNYLYTPLIGALTAVLLYLIVRAGFLAGSVDATSPFGFAALAAMTGLFTEQGVKKLKDVFETLLAKAEPGEHPLQEAAIEGGSG